MTNAEYNRLDQDRPTRTARKSPEIAFEDSREKRAAHKILRTALESPSGKKSLQPQGRQVRASLSA